jgi:Na+-driven multidrug efflux pump
MREVGAAIATCITYILNLIIADIWIRIKSGKGSEFEDMVFWFDKTMWKGDDLCHFL